MYCVTKDGDTFIIRNGMACFLYHVEEIPQEHREASQREIEQYDESHTKLWKLIADNIGLGKEVARKLGQFDEQLIRSITLDTLIRCAELYDSNNAAFSTYAKRALWRRFIDYFRKKKDHTLPEGYEFSVEDSLHYDACETVQYLMKGIEESDRLLLLLYYWKGLTHDEIAKVAGVSRLSICRDLKRIITSFKVKSGCEESE